MTDDLSDKMGGLQFGAEPVQEAQDMGFGQDPQNDFGFGNSNWNAGEQPAAEPQDFNAVSGAPETQDNTADAFGFDQPAHPDAPAEEAFAFDEPPKGDQIANIGEDAEELARIEEAQRNMQERLNSLRLKEDEEITQKRALKQKAQDELNEWYRKKNTAGEAKRKQNKEEEWAFIQTRDEHKKSKNPWEKIIDNVEIDQRKYLGTRDVTRMRQAMISRKQDLKKSS